MWVWLNILLIGLGLSHPFHASICNLSFNPQTHSLEIVQKVFVDDIEAVLQQQTTPQIADIEDALKGQQTAIAAYFKDALVLRINQQPVTWQYVGSEIQKAHLVVYIEVPNVDVQNLHNLSLKSTVLLHLAGQRNWVHWNGSHPTEPVQSLILTKAQPYGAFTLAADAKD